MSNRFRGKSKSFTLFCVETIRFRRVTTHNLTLLLADRSVKVPKEIIKDVILKVVKFYFPADFVVLNTEPVRDPSNHSPVILGRPFLATADAIIRCRNGVTTFSFGNITVELNAPY